MASDYDFELYERFPDGSEKRCLGVYTCNAITMGYSYTDCTIYWNRGNMYFSSSNSVYSGTTKSFSLTYINNLNLNQILVYVGGDYIKSAYSFSESLFISRRGCQYTKIVVEYSGKIYSSILKPNGASGSDQTSSVEYYTNYTIPACPYTRSGYTFKNWNTKADGSGTAYSPNTVVLFRFTSNLILYAQWTLNNYTLSFNSNGGVGSISPITIKFTYSTYLPIVGFSKSGHVLKGWNTASDGSGTFYGLGSQYTQNTVSNVTLYAIYGDIVQDINKTPISRFDTTSIGGGGRTWSKVIHSEIVSYTPQSTNTIQRWEKPVKTKTGKY